MLDLPRRWSIEQECAREIFSLFMLSICVRVERVEGRTQRNPGITPKAPSTISNTVFDALAEATVDAKLMVIPDDALALIIPAFARFGLLPSVENEDSGGSSGTVGPE